MYAIVRAGGRQEKVAVGDTVVLDRVQGVPGADFSLPAVLLVDGETVTTDPSALAAVTVTATIVDHGRGPKIDILKFKNKTGYRKRMGHRQDTTTVTITDIKAGK